MRVTVDLDLCQGHGVCESEAPEVFELGKDHKVRILDEVREDQRGPIGEAVRFCPTHALTLVDD